MMSLARSTRQPGRIYDARIAAAVIDLAGSRSKVVHRPLPEDDPRQRRPDTSKAHELLGWKPRTPLKERLKKTIAYFEGLLKISSVREMLSTVK
jgi:UDP-glucuronate decarboxylase